MIQASGGSIGYWRNDRLSRSISRKIGREDVEMSGVIYREKSRKIRKLVKRLLDYVVGYIPWSLIKTC